jgi:branched-chain amino acid transport system ATP-binding protein
VILTAENLQVRYRNGALGIVDVSISVDAGEIAVLFGPNGAGKTTTVRAISGFLKSEGARIVSGKVTIFGEDMTNAEPHRTTQLGVAFVPERQKIFPSLTVTENLSVLGRRPSRARRLQISDRIYDLFPQLAERQRELAGRLSGGQQQMLAIARSLMCEARLLIIDEMTLGLHTSVHAPLFDVLKAIASEGAAVVIVDESTSMALDVADHCSLLGAGEVRLAGPPEMFRGNELLAAGYVEAT